MGKITRRLHRWQSKLNRNESNSSKNIKRWTAPERTELNWICLWGASDQHQKQHPMWLLEEFTVWLIIGLFWSENKWQSLFPSNRYELPTTVGRWPVRSWTWQTTLTIRLVLYWDNWAMTNVLSRINGSQWVGPSNFRVSAKLCCVLAELTIRSHFGIGRLTSYDLPIFTTTDDRKIDTMTITVVKQ